MVGRRLVTLSLSFFFWLKSLLMAFKLGYRVREIVFFFLALVGGRERRVFRLSLNPELSHELGWPG